MGEYRRLIYTSLIWVMALLLVPNFAFSQCEADAGPNQTICQGESVTLGGNPTAIDAPPGVTYNWNNGAADVANPVVSPNSTTTYTVELGGGGGCNNEEDQITITVIPAPNANFTFSPNNQCANVPVNFTNTTTGCNNCTYEWNFGDPSSGSSNTSTSQNPSHTFSAFGGGSQSFTVTLTVTGPGPNFCQDVQTANVTVNQVPQISLVDPITDFTQCSGDPAFPVTVFDGSTPATNANYTINWGDGSPNWTSNSSPQGVVHNYTQTDIFNLIYTVTGTNGCSASEDILVSNITNPAIGAGIDGGTQGCAPLDICFNILNFANNHESTTYVVNFGDGSPLQNLNHPPPPQICHSYTGSSCENGGAYTFTITAVNSCDNSVATITPVRVYTAPQANFDATPVPGCINTPITFTNTSVLGYNNSCSQTALFTWSWGDGSPNTIVTTNAAQSHTYTAAGNYTVTLSAQNSCGTTTISQVVCIETPPTPVFTVDNNLGCVPMTVSTTNTSNNGIPCSVNYAWIVDYTDLPCAPNTGTYSFTGGTSASSLEPDFLLSSVGTYTIRLQMTNSCGVFQDVETVTVNTTPVVAVNTIATICSGNTVTPVGVVNACNLPITSYVWNLPGGSPATANTLSPGPITYATAGTYTATLTATNACGPSSGSATVNVLAPPVVNITTSTGNTAFCSGSNVSLTASGAANYTWMPGNLSGSTINISPTANTTYTVTGTSGTCTDQETISITINPLPTVTPTGTFSMCAGETEQLSVNVNGGTAPYTNYSWNNGATLSSTTISNPISSATTTTTYTVQVTDSNGCVGVGNVPVTVNPLPVVNAGPDNQLCNQPVATALTGYSPTTGGTGVWSGPGVTSGGTFTPSAIGCFDLTYTFTNSTTGCTNSDIVQICVVDPVPANGGPDLSACFGAPAVALPAGGTWSGTNVTGNTFTPSTVGTYTLTFTVGSGSCQTSDNIQATVLAAPVVNAGTDIANLCAGQTVQLNGTANSANGAITSSTWTSPCGGISDATALNPNITPTTGACTYTLSATDAAGCQATDQVLVNVNALPVVNAGADLVLCNQPIATALTGFSPAGGTWSADPGIGLSGTNVTPQGVGVFNLTYTYTNPTTNCTNTDIVVVTINDPSNTDAGPDVELCLNTPVYNIVAPTPGGTWTVTPQVTASGAFTPNTVGTYNLTYTVGSGTCATSDNMNVIVNGLPTIDVGPDGSICLNDSLAVNGTISGGEAPYTVSWNFPATLSNPNSAITFAFPSVTTNYTVTVTDNNQCVDTDNIIVTVNGLPTVNAGNDLILCDQPIEEVLTGFSPTSGGTGTWTGTGIVDPSGSFLSPGVGTYWLYYEFTAGGNACSNTDSILVTVNAPVIADAGSDLTFCLNDAQYTFTGVTPAAGGTWSGSGITNTSAGVFNPSVAGVGSYTITIEYGSGTCYTTDDVDITVLGLPTVDAGPDDTACGNADPFDMTGFTPAIGGIWEGTGITNSTTGNFDPAIGTGTYDVFLWYTDPLTGCADTSYKVVNVSPVPNAAFTVPAQGCTNSPADIVNNSTGATQYDWDFGDGTTFSDIDPVYTYPDEGFFDIMLVAINNFGCRDTMILNNEIVDPPSAQFNLLPSEGCAPLVVDFENVSVGQYLSFEWDLSITTSINQTPQTLTYQQGPDVMIYPISLTATNYCGSDQAVDEVTVFPQPVAGFGTNMDVFCSPFTVVFNNTSTGLPDTYEWNFGDGSPNVFVEEPISHVFYTGEEPTDYTIYLYLENECGLDTAEYTITVLPNTVTSFFNTNITQGCSPLEVEFTDFSEGGNQIQYNFGDGTFTATANPTHIFDDAGEYTIYQYVDNGCSYDTTFIVIEVYPSPEIDFTTNDASICVNEGIQFTPLYSDVVGITWDFGDGSTSTLSAPLHVFETSGQYIVTATAESDNQCTTDVTHPVTVYSAPTTAFSVPNQVGCSPFNLCFSDASQGAVFYEWDFGDGNTDNIAEPCNLYENFTAAPQLYTIRLITQNMQLCSDTTYMDVIVSPQPVAAYTLSTFESCYFPVEANTTNFSNYANGYSWLLDGEEISDLTNTTFEFNEVGTYNTTLIASNQYGCSSESSIDYTVHPLPVIGLDALPYEGCVPLLVDFQNISTGAIAFEWDFGDGNTSNAFSPTHNYTNAGFYDVSLIGITDQGCRDTLAVDELISVYPIPQAMFTLSPEVTTIYEPQIMFYDGSFGANQWFWTFGDGTASYDQFPIHVYEEGGYYTIGLLVTSGAGCRSYTERNLYIEDIFNIYVPNSFTPDDDGINEVFIPKLTGRSFVERYTFQIFDRWGTVIFETHDMDEPWTGDVRGGEYYAKDEAYNWQVRIQLKGVDDERVYSGHVIMLR